MQEENKEIQSQFNVTDPVKKNLKRLFVKPTNNQSWISLEHGYGKTSEPCLKVHM